MSTLISDRFILKSPNGMYISDRGVLIKDLEFARRFINKEQAQNFIFRSQSKVDLSVIKISLEIKELDNEV